MPNRLQHAQSPYLLQHQDNPVDWWAWSDAAFEAAREQDKPVFLSIGYSTCHWCHVMAHESFEDAEVAQALNRAFINIKVDREERPDVDAIYMTVCQMMTGHGGWPLTVLMTPDKKPFFAATYIPKHSRHGRIGMLDLIPRIERAWQDERDKVTHTADQLTGHLQEAAEQPGAERGLDRDLLHLAYSQLRQRFDPKYGGFGTAPKFPSAHNLIFLLRYGQRTGEAAARQMVETTLRQMRLGGVYDHLGYGFHRYATDAQWKLPHFEKMLYDQTMLTMAYTEAYEATGNDAWREIAREICTYVLRDMTAPEGGFYSAEDADSEGREGTFYVWTEAELRDVLDDEPADLFLRAYNVEAAGNFEDEATRQKTGENILYLKAPIEDLAGRFDLEPDDLERRLEQTRERLFAHREQRVHPGKDDKILTDWNGLMIAALARAARAFRDAGYEAAARRAADFILKTMRATDGRLVHRYRQGEAALPGMLDDYAFFVWGLLELYETAFEPTYLEAAVALNRTALDHFWDAEHGAFFLAPNDADDLIVRQKEAYDGAHPSGNSIAMMNLLRLGRLTGNANLEQRADELGRYFADTVRRQPSGFSAMLQALDFAVGPTFEVVIAGAPETDDTQAMIEAVRSVYAPNKVVVLRPSGDAEAIISLVPYAEAQKPVDGKATAYVCRHFACDAPTTDPDAVREALAGNTK